ncbi:MAG TPA: cobalt transporter CbiM [Terriglobia bacterium]|nr:cobalt transporter CbiM [Terriglobia bacterium]
MHIPDGYLSPSTCVLMYGASAPFWSVAMRKMKRALNTRLIPLLSVVSAFSFVIMMFNVPLPGGTTGHAVGMGVASVVLGPWASMLAISIAILIQALFFGDGGITTLGANCFNMAIVGSLVAYVVYRLAAGRAPLVSSRRVVAAALGGYVAINTSALCAAIELGTQPLLFKTAAGAPLYAPYPLRIAVPAMLIGHLTFAGLAELVISASVIAYLQRTNPVLLAATAPGATTTALLPREIKRGWAVARPLWIGVALLMILTPLGILAAGTAWAEWSARDFSDPVARHEIMIASGRQAPPLHAPGGLERLSSLWTAPFAGYRAPFFHERFFGYLMSALVGGGIILGLFLFVNWLVQRRRRLPSDTDSL